MTEGQLVSLAVVGWTAALLLLGQWWGERKARIFIQNFTAFGGTPRKATVYSPPDAEDAIEEAIDRIEGIANTKRSTPPEDAKFHADTLQNGIDWLLHQAKESGTSLTVEQATEEALLMLNAEGTEM